MIEPHVTTTNAEEHTMPTAIAYSQYGTPDVLVATEVEPPTPGPGQVRIHVRAVAVNPIDVKLRSGQLKGVFDVMFPAIPGWDVAGTVDAVGAGADAKVGDNVFGVATGDGYAEYALLNNPVPKPDDLSFELAAGLITVGEAAYRTLRHLDVQPGQTLLIHGAGGSAGTIAVQLAVSRGVTVIATAAEHDHARLAALGATPVMYGEGWLDRVRAAAPQGVDAVIDLYGGGVLAESVELTGDPARVITTSDPAAEALNVRFTGGNPADRFPEALPALAALAADGDLALPIWRTYPLAQAGQAHADIEQHRNRGKVVLIP
jgi:NADPH:quinone reductase-like Zn-dependent oxidoreductase